MTFFNGKKDREAVNSIVYVFTISCRSTWERRDEEHEFLATGKCEEERIADTREAVKIKLRKWDRRDGDGTDGHRICDPTLCHLATETPHLNHHIQLCNHRTADNVAVAWLSDPKLWCLLSFILTPPRPISFVTENVKLSQISRPQTPRA